ncbi:MULTISPECIES: transposase [unclassified Mesorhizobium]|uniref:transposase n=2 Tax=unclassified Mesorhizobium TaxID=325217 RepID=UPI001FED9F2F|nr:MULTISPECIES: transposase [unclassified Mesorhizobium]
MKRQIRPFIVEMKQRRGKQKPSHSIWGDLDLSKIATEMTQPGYAAPLPNSQVIDFSIRPLDAEEGDKPQAEYMMADFQDAQTVQTTVAPAKVEVPESKKKVPRAKKSKAELVKPARKNGAKPAPAAAEAPVAAKTARKTYSEKERAQKLAQIEKSIAAGATSKIAVGQAGISEQTYYYWKKAAAPSSDSGDLRDLVALEEENKRLKNLLADRLRKENAELKKKLGLA